MTIIITISITVAITITRGKARGSRSESTIHLAFHMQGFGFRVRGLQSLGIGIQTVRRGSLAGIGVSRFQDFRVEGSCGFARLAGWE